MKKVFTQSLTMHRYNIIIKLYDEKEYIDDSTDDDADDNNYGVVMMKRRRGRMIVMMTVKNPFVFDIITFSFFL